MAPPGGQKNVPPRRNPFLRPGQSRGASPGRITKPNDNTRRTWTPAVFKNCSPEVPDLTKLHPHYQPRSPVQTRQKTAQNALQQQQQQQVAGSSGESSSGGKSTTSVPTISISNPYGLLEEDNGNRQGNDDDADDDDDDKGQPKAKVQNKKQPPIVIPDYPGAAVDNLLSRAGCEYEILILKQSIRVSTLNRPMYEKVVRTLKEGNVPFYSYDSRDQKSVKIVLTGYVPVAASQLAEVLAEYDIHPQEIRVLSSTETVTGEHVLYLLVFDRGSVKIQDLRRIKTLDGFVVSWRYFVKRPSDAAQCHRCQRFGHGSRNCTLAPKCVKCGETHLTDQCSLPRKSNLGENNNAERNKARIKCVNCQGNHTANFRGCSARKSYLEVLEKQRKKPASRQTSKSSSSTVQTSTHPPGWGRSYASVVASSGVPASSADAPADGAGDLFTLSEFLSLARDMFTRFRACQNKEQQFLALGELMMKYVGTT